ncbi:MAG: SGNH/GDSL hydrolase family protein [Candidatus Omnitrophica bacterium]|nr:SGNH/GDSL hydrolase family protein [Candidatus Omnitrophota bacterium]
MSKKILKKTITFKIAIFSGALFCALVLGETVFRFFRPIGFSNIFSHSEELWNDKNSVGKGFFNKAHIRVSKLLGYELIKNSSLGTNSLGMLDKEYEEVKRKDVCRVIFLGDSTTASCSSEYVEILEEQLNKNLAKEKYELWNCAVPGYNVIQYYHALKEKWLNFNPDMVVIGFCLNDFSTTPVVIKEKDSVTAYYPKKEILRQVNPWLIKHSALYRFIIFNRFSLAQYNFDKIIEGNKDYLKELNQLLLEKEIPLLVIILGLPVEFEDYGPYWTKCYRQIKDFLEKHEISYLDTVPVFESNNPRTLIRKNKDAIHFNEKASRLIVELLAEYLNKVHIID